MVRRSSIAVALVASFILAGSDNLISAQSIAAGQRVVLDALAQITGRSPGDRTSAVLTKVKGEPTPRRNAHALARTRTKPKAQHRMAPVQPSDDELAAFHPVPLFAAAAFPGLSNGSASGSGFSSFSPFLGGGGGGGFIGGGGSGGGEGPPNGTEPAPAVPEPATWTTLILGFGLVGAFLRRRRQRSEPKLG